MSCKVSVIIPVYNGIRYLRDCVESVQKQTLREIEILLVDDGSTDGSSELADTLALQDKRIHVMHQTNAGVSAARNAALDVAQGEYIGFVDADDLAEPEMFATLYGMAKEKQCEIASCAFVSFDDSGVIGQSTAPSEPGTVLTHSDIVQRLPTLSTDRTFQFIWRRIFSAALIQENAIRFDPEISIGEDTLFCMACFLHASRMTATDQLLYRYRHQMYSALRRRVYKPNLLRSLEKQYVQKYNYCAEYCPEDLPVFVRDSAKRSVDETFRIAISNVYRKPRRRFQEYRALIRTKWTQDTLQYAQIPHSRSMDWVVLRCLQKKRYFIGFCLAKFVFGKGKYNE